MNFGWDMCLAGIIIMIPLRGGRQTRSNHPAGWFILFSEDEFKNVFLNSSSENKNPADAGLIGFAEREGFEPPEVLPSTVFKTAAIDHSAISPLQKYIFFKFSLKKFSVSKGFDEKSIFSKDCIKMRV